MGQLDRLSGYWNRPVRRRRFVGAGLALSGSAAFLAACSSSNNNSGNSNAAKPAVSATTASTTVKPSATSGSAGTAVATRAGASPAAASPAAGAALVAGTPQNTTGPAPVAGGISRTAGGAQVFDSVDPMRALGDPTLNLANAILSHLVYYADPDKGIVNGDLAQSYEIVSPSQYNFKLRQGVKFQNIAPANGREFTSDDVKWFIQRQASGMLSNGQAVQDMNRKAFYSTITKIDTPDKYTVNLTYAAPNGSVLDYWSAYFSSIPNREATEKYENDPHTLNEGAMIGTGPFQLLQWRNGKPVLYKRNPDYYMPGRPLLDGVIGEAIFEDPNAQRAAFEQKQIDLITPPDDSVAQALLDAHKGVTYETDAAVANTVVLFLNTLTQFKDPRLVMAMNLAVDRRGLFQQLHHGLGQVSGPVPWLAEGYALPTDQLVKYDGYGTDRNADMTKARQLWSAGGGASIGQVDIKVPQTWLAVYPDTPQILTKMFSDSLGVQQFTSSQSDYNTEIIPNLPKGTDPNWFGWSSLINSPNPRETMRQGYHTGAPTNWNKVSNPQLDALLDQAAMETDLNKAIDLNRQAQVILLNNAQYGTPVLYNYIVRSVAWNYAFYAAKQAAANGKPAVTYNLPYGLLTANYSWINQKDPTYQGRPAASLSA